MHTVWRDIIYAAGYAKKSALRRHGNADDCVGYRRDNRNVQHYPRRAAEAACVS